MYSLNCTANIVITKDALVIGVNLELFITRDPGATSEAAPDAFIANIYTILVKVLMNDGRFTTILEVAESWELISDGKT